MTTTATTTREEQPVQTTAHARAAQSAPLLDIDAMNRTFYDDMHDVAFADVRAQGIAARNQMLRAWRSLPEESPEADRWISKAGPEHYAQHLPRLREWVRELGAS